MKSLRMLVLAGLCITAACQPKEHYPYSPQFAAPMDVPARMLAVPPKPNSPTYLAAIDDIIQRQKKIDAKTQAAILDEAPVVPEMMATHVLGKDVTRANFPKLYALLGRSGSDAHRISDVTKDYWHTKRPYLSDSRVRLLVDAVHNPSYPSGHTLIGHVWAGVLSDVAPCKRNALFARANIIAEHRIDAGAHYSYDITAGKQMAAQIMKHLHASGAYQAALADTLPETAGKFCA